MQNKEFDKLVESFLKPKTKLEDNASFSLASLLSLVEEVENADKLINEVIRPSVVLPTTSPQNKKYEPEAQEVTKFFEIFQKVLAQNILSGTIEERLQKLIKDVNFLKSTQDRVPNTVDYLSKTFAIILFVGSLNNMIGNLVPDLPSVAGTFFEKFIAFMAQGTPMGEKNKIYDIVKGNEYISLKLVKDFSYRGSINEMGDFFTGRKDIPLESKTQHNDKILTVIVGVKKSIQSGTIQFYSYRFGFQEFLEMLGQERLEIYNKPIKLKMDLERQQLKNANIKNQIENLKTKRDFADARNQENIVQQIEMRIADLELEIEESFPEIKKIEIDIQDAIKVPNRTQFNIDKKMLDQIPDQQKIMAGKEQDILSLSYEERERIIENNQNLFNQSIKVIIDESNAVYYKINNFLLSDEKERKTNALDAYDSVSRLEQNLVKYTT